MPTLHLLPDDPGLWEQRLTATDFTGAACRFLDRDGVIMDEAHFPSRAEDVSLVPGTAAAVAKLNAAGIAVVVVTNQSGIARGLFGWKAFGEVQDEMARQLAAEGAHVDVVLACGYHTDGVAPFDVDGHPWRKPNPGMVLRGIEMLGVDPARSFIVGDRVSDLLAGKNAGLSRGALVRTGYGVEHERKLVSDPLGTFPVSVHNTLGQALSALT